MTVTVYHCDDVRLEDVVVIHNTSVYCAGVSDDSDSVSL